MRCRHALGERGTKKGAGLVNKVVPLSDHMTEAERIARRTCENAPLAVKATGELAVRG